MLPQRLGFNIYKAENMNGHRNIFTVDTYIAIWWMHSKSQWSNR